MKIDKETIKKSFVRIEVRADIKVDKANETAGKELPIEVRVRRDKNKDLYKLRDFFACKTDPKIKARTFQSINDERYLYRSYFVNLLRKSFSAYDFLLVHEIVYHCSDISDVGRFNNHMNDFISTLAQAYNMLLNEKTITMTYVSREGGDIS